MILFTKPLLLRVKILCVCVLFTLGCSAKKEDSNLEERVAVLETENKMLKQKLEDIEGSNKNQTGIYLNENSSPSFSSTFAFVFMEVEQEEIDVNSPGYKKPVHYIICSPVKEFKVYDEAVKYQFMDAVQTNYLSIQGKVYNGKIIKRECYSFSDYQSASKEREKYILSN